MTSRTILTEVHGFTPLIDALVEEQGVMDAVVFGRVWRYCQMETGKCLASVERIAHDLGLSMSTVRRHLQRLCEEGYLKDETPDRRNAPHAYSDTGKVQLIAIIKAGLSERTTKVSQKDQPRLVRKTNEDSSLREKEDSNTGPEPNPLPEYPIDRHFTEVFEDVMDFLRKSGNRKESVAATAEFCAACFGGKPEYGRIGRMGKKHRDQYRRICQVALECVAKSPRGNPYNYLEACLKGLLSKGGGRDAKKKQGSHSGRGPKHRVADRAEFDKARREVQERKAAEAGG